MRKLILMVVVSSTLFAVTRAQGVNDDAKCRAARIKAAGKYQKCIDNWLTSYYKIVRYDLEKLTKCREKYADTWSKLQEFTGSVCDGPRWVDNGLTVTDNLTGLKWEKKTDDASEHDVDNLYTYSDYGDADEYDQDGTAFTIFLAALNAGGGFDGANGWRLPTYAELLTLLTIPCGSSCLDPAFGGIVASSRYLSGTSYPEYSLTWHVSLTSNDGFPDNIAMDSPASVRAVSGGFW